MECETGLSDVIVANEAKGVIWKANKAKNTWTMFAGNGLRRCRMKWVNQLFLQFRNVHRTKDKILWKHSVWMD